MLHELLLALSGYSGDLFVQYPSGSEQPETFKIPPDFPFLHDAERSSLERLAELGFYYHKILDFLDQQRNKCLVMSNDNSNNSNNNSKGLFIQALCNSINDILKDFQKIIIESEMGILNKEANMCGIVPISQIVSAFGDYFIILPNLYQLINELKEDSDNNKYFGCRILNLMKEKCNSGIPELRSIMLILLQTCHKVMYQHITSWIVYGHLQDPYGEFFVKDLTTKSHKKIDNNDKDNNNHQFIQSSWHRRFVLDESFIPNHISIDIAKSILFVGKAIATVKNSGKSSSLSSSSYNSNSALPQEIRSLHLKYLMELSSQPIFHKSEFESTILTIRHNVAKWLWQVVLTGEKVIDCLETFRNYFLLGKGNFALSLVEQFEKITIPRLSTRIISIKEQELNSLLIRASMDIIDSNFYKLVQRITISSAHHQQHNNHSTNINTNANASKKPVADNKNKNYSEMEETLRDFEDIRLGHASYLNDLLRGCLLEFKVCSETIKSSLKICEQFCTILERWNDFREQISFLFRTLSEVNKTGEGFDGPPRHLDQFLLRLDFSKWFSAWSI
ncbi:20798_t:CDS:2 [Entrophospora sp. SA101]|nr:3956_t:CDS:2 [Entrophospora sp. SA101]CAJ0861328.1 20798_t:CDS:2 [Entrophospora sp. SA101]